jgi:hypothetical protein
MIDLPPQRPKPLVALLGLVVVVELLTVLVVGNWIYDFQQFRFAADNAGGAKKVGS